MRDRGLRAAPLPHWAFGTCSVSQNKASTRYSVTQKRLAGHGERKAEGTGLRLRLRGVRADGLEEAWALEHVYVDTAPGSITRCQ